jgi:hypothetical protein
VDRVVETARAQLAEVRGAHPASACALHTHAETGSFEELHHAA